MNSKALACIFAVAGLAGAQAQTFNAGADYVIEDNAGYTYSDTGSYMNFGVVATYKSLGVWDFDASSLGTVGGVSSATLTLQESDYTNTRPVNLTFWAVADNTADLHHGQTTVGYDDGTLGGYSGQLGSATQLATFAFTSTNAGNANGVTNQQDVIDFTTGLSAIAGQINSASGNVRILATTDESGYATFTGAGPSSAFVPTLNVTTTPVPEPVSIATLGLGVLGLISRRRGSK